MKPLPSLGTHGWTSLGIAAGIGLNACISSALATLMPVLLVEVLKTTYLQASLFMIAATGSSAAAASMIGRASDKVWSRHGLAVGASICGVAGALVLVFADGVLVHLVVFVSLLAVAGSLFPQLMALAFLHDRTSTPRMRAVASAGWIVGPPATGLLLSAESTHQVFLLLALAYAGLLMLIQALAQTFRRLELQAANSQHPVPGMDGRPVTATVAVLASLHFLMALCALTVPWRILELNGSATQVGIAFALAAAVEIPFIVCSTRIAEKLSFRTMLAGCSGISALCCFIGATSQHLGGVLVVSLLNGVATGMMMGGSLLILQGLFPDRPGQASAIYSNMLRLTYVAALLAAGLIAELLAVSAIFWIASAIAVTLTLSICAGERRLFSVQPAKMPFRSDP